MAGDRFGGTRGFDPDCDVEYPMHVQNTVEVEDCQSVPTDVIKKMVDQLYAKAERACAEVCKRSSKGCTKVDLSPFVIDEDVCEGKFWTINATFPFKCVK